MLLTLSALWGGSFLFIRVAAPEFGPFALVDVRVLLAGVTLALYARLARVPLSLASYWRPLVTLGAINAAVPFTLIAAAELQLPASLAAIVNAVTPLCAAIVGAMALGTRLTGKALAGLALGIAGVSLTVGGSALSPSAATLLAVGASLGAALAYAFGGIYANTGARGIPLLTLAAGQQLCAGALLLPFALAAHPTHWPTTGALLALLALSIPATAVGYLLYFALMARVGPTNTLTVTFLVPGFGLLWGAIFLGERIRAGTIVGLIIVLTSIVLVTNLRPPWSTRVAAGPPPEAIAES